MNSRLTICQLFVSGALGLAVPGIASAQEIVPSIEWERFYQDSACSFGSVVQTADGGCILGGTIYEILDDVGSLPDIILVKTDSQGDLQWQKRYGGTGYEDIASVRQTIDGGYLFVGTSDSPPSSDKESPDFGLGDVWVVKVDSEGNKQWDRSFGGTSGDSAASMWATTDGGFVIAGYSASRPSGNKESPKFGISDGWVVKIDAQGNKQWDRSFGGQSVQGFSSVRETLDRGYILAGQSSSSPSGNKEAPNFGGPDGWLVKIDAGGNKQWDQSYGGTKPDGFSSLDKADDGGFIVGGISSSPPSGNKDSIHFGGTNYWIEDYWIVKVDAEGNKQWDRSYGTPMSSEELRVVRQTSDGGYILGGMPRLVKTDFRGNQDWQEFAASGVSTNDYMVDISDLQQTKEGGYIVCGSADYPTAEMPAPGCDRSSWVAKLENVVSRSGEVVTWKADAGLVLESVDDLNGEWRSDQTEVLSVGVSSAIALIPSSQQRYYRLQETGPSSDPPSLSIGALLKWPVAQNQTLEISSSKDGPWEAFSGEQGIIGEAHYAIIPQNLRHHCFRTRKID